MKKQESKDKENFSKFIIRNRFVAFAVFLIISFVTHYFFTDPHSFFPVAETKDLWFYSGIVMVLFSILFIEPYYTSPKNVIANVIPLILVFISIKEGFNNQNFWWIAIIFLLLLLFISIVAMAIEDKNKSPDSKQNKFSSMLKTFAILFGNGKFLYSAMFFYFLLSYRSIDDTYVLILFVYWFVILILDPKSFHNEFWKKKRDKDSSQIGEIFGVQSNNVILAKLFTDKNNIRAFDLVKFRHSMSDSSAPINLGVIFDTYLLDQEKWIKILSLKNVEGDVTYDKDIVYKVSKQAALSREVNIDRFIGIVIEKSQIGKIRFEYSKKVDNLQEGDLLELVIGSKRVFYQVVTATTEKEVLEAKNETGLIEGEAIQLGEWDQEGLSFKKYGWVPTINTPIFLADTSDIEVKEYSYPDYKLGNIPGTTLPSVINLSDAVSHHIALLGITGSGKSFLAREIIDQLKQDTKIICVDFTGEWRGKLSEEDVEDFTDIASAMSTQKVALIELNSVSNTTESLVETNRKLQEIFSYAKAHQGNGKICLVLEEAHTIVPETTFLGDYGDYSANKALVNKMSQIALQGRKYGVGLMVIAQRTANVSKTVLTQCNTVVCFQAFDDTSFSFLGNYLGASLVKALPDLRQYHAVVVGKAFKSKLPMIINLERTSE